MMTAQESSSVQTPGTRSVWEEKERRGRGREERRQIPDLFHGSDYLLSIRTFLVCDPCFAGLHYSRALRTVISKADCKMMLFPVIFPEGSGGNVKKAKKQFNNDVRQKKTWNKKPEECTPALIPGHCGFRLRGSRPDTVSALQSFQTCIASGPARKLRRRSLKITEFRVVARVSRLGSPTGRPCAG